MDFFWTLRRAVRNRVMIPFLRFLWSGIVSPKRITPARTKRRRGGAALGAAQRATPRPLAYSRFPFLFTTWGTASSLVPSANILGHLTGASQRHWPDCTYVIERLSSMTCIQLRFLRRDLLWSYQGGGTPRRVASSCRPLPHIEFSSKNLSMFKVESRRHMANWHCLIFRQTYWLMEAKTQSSFLSLILANIFIVLILKNKFIYVSSESWSFARMLDEGEIVKIDNGKKKKSN